MTKKKLRECSAVYTVGAVGYSAIEILWRGFTHWTMALTGGLCFLLFHLMNCGKLGKKPLWRRCAAGCGVITGVEFTVGCVVNRIFHLKVWDYSKMPFNLLGQVCLLYSVLWFLLCVPMTGLSKALHRRLR